MKLLNKYEDICIDIVDEFVEKYFVDNDNKRSDFDLDWVANEIGGVVQISDYYFSMNDIVETLRLQPSKEQLFNWYNKCLDDHIGYSLKYFLSNKFTN